MVRRIVSALCGVAVIALAGGSLAAGAASAADPAQGRHDAIVRYWTPDRIRAAIPRDFEFDPASHGYLPAAKPIGGGGGGTSVSGASWTGGGLILTASGVVLFHLPSGDYICSGSVSTDTDLNTSLVLTAAHCAYDESTQTFATNWMFFPEYDSAPIRSCTDSRWGCWTAQSLVVDSGYASAGGFNTQAATHDFAFAVVGFGGKTGATQLQLDVTVGSLPITFGGISSGQFLDAFGYPAAAPYSGNDLTYCAGKISGDFFNGSKTWGMTCNMTGGASGGPWLSQFTGGSGIQSSLNSYRYNGINKMFGPKFNSNTQAVYNFAATPPPPGDNKIVTVP